jgi:vacuolar-type H+-ATPase subunit E/Vma4
MQLGTMNAMLRGLPLQTQTTQLYQAQPTSLQQGIGLLGAGASLFGLKEGGVIKMAKGGIANAIPGYKYGSLISEPKLESMADDLSIAQLQQRLKDPALTPGEREVFREALEAKINQEKTRMSGIAAAGGPAFESQGMAGGGIVAFAAGDLIEEEPIDPETGLPYTSVNPLTRFGQYMNPFSGPGSLGSIARGGKSIEETYEKPREATAADRTRQAQMESDDRQEGPGVTTTPTATAGTQGTKGAAAVQAKEDRAAAQGPNSFAKFLAEIKEAGPKGEVGAQFEQYLDERLGKSAERLARDERMAMAKGFLKFASTPAPGGIGQAAAAGLTEYATGVEAARKAQDTMENEAQKARMELDKARRAEERGDVAAAQEAYNKYEDRMNRIKTAQISAGAAGQAGRFEREAVERVMAENPGMKFADALQIVKGAGRFESNELQRAKAALEQINNSLLFMKKDDPRRAELEAQRQQILGMLTPGGGIGGGQGAPAGGGVMRFDAKGNLIR